MTFATLKNYLCAKPAAVEEFPFDDETLVFKVSGKMCALIGIHDDPWSILRCSNKIYLYERLARGRIRQPRSWLLTRHTMSAALKKSLTYPLVLKLPESSFSLGVYKVEDEAELSERLKAMFRHSDLVIAQEFLLSNYDWRIGVLDQRLQREVAALRQSPAGYRSVRHLKWHLKK